MDLIKRQLQDKVCDMAAKFPFVTISGPRQSGKTTLSKMAFPDYRIVSLEDLDMRNFASEDPRGFINSFPDKVIIDEVQRVPSLLSYLQTHADREGKDGMYVLTGSQNFNLMQAIDQSLAGRTTVQTLLPLSCHELYKAGILPKSIDQQIFNGGYPRLYAKDISPQDYYSSYIRTYVERDMRQLIEVLNLDKFVKFMKLCAGRIGQLLNKSSLANETGVSVPTIDAWLSVLKAGYIVYELKPYHENFSKRLVKTPKLYFYDTGVACSFLGITSADQLSSHYLRGGLFENLVINEVLKKYYNQGTTPNLYFWRDSVGHEVDLVDATTTDVHLYEIKSSATFTASFFDNINHWNKLSAVATDKRSVIYNGEEALQTANGNVIPWVDFLQI